MACVAIGADDTASLTPVSAREAAPTVIDAAYPGGNIIVDKIEGDTCFLRPDLRDTRTGQWWFYWNFRVRGAAGRTLHFRFTERNPIDFCGPTISRDGGVSWLRLGAEAVRIIPGQKAWEFSYTFGAAEAEVRFCFTIPYLQTDLERFLARYRGNPHLEIGELCRTRKGRVVERLRLGKLDGGPEFRVLLTARHHACESIANFELEGIVESVLAATAEGRWWREHVEFIVVPFMDKDGVEDGDQGKVRTPRDHNRDYDGISVHPEVAAMREQAPAWLQGKPLFVLDLHCPYIREENIYLVGGRDETLWRRTEDFSRLLESTQEGSVRYYARNNMPFGKGWNTAKLTETDPGKNFVGWASELPGVMFAATLEFPYSKKQADVSAESARAFGRDIARAIRLFLTQVRSPAPASEVSRP